MTTVFTTSGPAPKCEEAPAPLRPAAIEITPEMIEAAARRLWDSGRLEHDQGAMKSWVGDLAKEMLATALKVREALG
jgi:hypothetical protein